jgi:hypothetical protein
MGNCISLKKFKSNKVVHYNSDDRNLSDVSDALGTVHSTYKRPSFHDEAEDEEVSKDRAMEWCAFISEAAFRFDDDEFLHFPDKDDLTVFAPNAEMQSWMSRALDPTARVLVDEFLLGDVNRKMITERTLRSLARYCESLGHPLLNLLPNIMRNIDSNDEVAMKWFHELSDDPQNIDSFILLRNRSDVELTVIDTVGIAAYRGRMDFVKILREKRALHERRMWSLPEIYWGNPRSLAACAALGDQAEAMTHFLDTRVHSATELANVFANALITYEGDECINVLLSRGHWIDPCHVKECMRSMIRDGKTYVNPTYHRLLTRFREVSMNIARTYFLSRKLHIVACRKWTGCIEKADDAATEHIKRTGMTLATRDDVEGYEACKQFVCHMALRIRDPSFFNEGILTLFSIDKKCEDHQSVTP